METIIYQSAALTCSPRKAFEMFTVDRHLEKWLTKKANVVPKVGGEYELFWNPKDKENDSTIGCKIVGLTRDRFLAFDWKGPKQFKHFMNNIKPLTLVVVIFLPNRKVQGFT